MLVFVGDRLCRANQRVALAVPVGAGVLLRGACGAIRRAEPSSHRVVLFIHEVRARVVGDRLCRANQRAALAGLGLA